jgi:hypothetical protein
MVWSGVEWLIATPWNSMEFLKEMPLSLIGQSFIPSRKAVSFC